MARHRPRDPKSGIVSPMLTPWQSVHGEKVCQAVFLYANSCTRHVLRKVQAHLAAGCVVTPTHGLSGKNPWNVHSDEENLSATLFTQNYADVHGLPKPAAPRGHNKPRPCHTTKTMVHGLASSCHLVVQCPMYPLQGYGKPHVQIL